MAVNLSFIGGAGWQFFDDNGDPLSGGKIYTYVAGTTTPLVTYTSRSGTTPNPNPIILDAAGRTPQQIWVPDGVFYKYSVYTSTNVLVRTWDNIGAAIDMDNRSVANVASLVANATFTYEPNSTYTVVQSDIIRTRDEDFTYSVAAPNATNYHLTTANGVKLYLLPTSAGYYNFAGLAPDTTGVADCWDKLNVLLNNTPVFGVAPWQSTTPIYFPNGTYYFSQTIELKRSTKLFGFSSGLPYDAPAIFKFPTNTTGIIVNRSNTFSNTTVTATTAADATIIEGIALYSTVGTDLTKHGIWLRARAVIRNVFISQFSGNGINIVASAGSGGATEGNANSWRIDTVRVENCGGNGVYVDGADANAGYGNAIDVTNNRLWGIYESSFLGNTWEACHADANGGTATNSAYATYGGNHYHAVPGNSSATLGSTQPGTNSNVWRLCNPTKYPIAWTGSNPAGTFREGGGYYSDNPNARNTFVGCYVEGGQGLTWHSQHTIVIGGLYLECPIATGAYVLGQFGLPLSLGYVAQGDVSGTSTLVTATLGGDPSNGVMLAVSGTNSSNVSTGTWRLKQLGDGLIFDNNNLASRRPLTVTGGTDTYPYRLKMDDMVLGTGGTARAFGRVGYSTAPGVVFPTSGTYERGDIYFAPNPIAGDYIGWVCTTGGVAGSTAVFKKFGAIAP